MSTIKAQVIQARENGYSYSEIYNEFGVPKSTARDWIVKNNEGVLTEPKGYVNTNLSRDRLSYDGDLLEFIQQLAPINISPTYDNTKIKSELNDYAVVGSDFHFGTHDQKAIDIFLETIFELQPKTIVLNGDTMDFLAISRYPKDIKVNWSLQKEREAYHAFLHELVNISNGAQIFETYSNHSGQSIDGRWRRYLSDRLGELASLDDISDILSYENVFLGKYQDFVKHVDYVDLNGLIVTHGTTVRKNGGYSARGEIEKWGTSILHGHTHRIGSTCQRVPAIGNRKEQQIYGFEGGCLCSLDAVYASAPNWQQGFSIVGLGGETFSLEQVMINNGKANIATLGKTLTSL